jgi:(p)ppGpp synthase/HD superfamily hydrolase
MDISLINKVKEYAVNMHNKPSKSQRYGAAPYSKHLIDVVEFAEKYLYYLNDDEQTDVLCACWAHDLVEDTEATPNKLKKLFNDVIAKVVLAVSNERGWDKKEILFKTLPKIWQNRLAKFVKLCDRLANGTNSKNGYDERSKSLYERYAEEYPVFRYALKEKGEFDNMWAELDSIFKYNYWL